MVWLHTLLYSATSAADWPNRNKENLLNVISNQLIVFILFNLDYLCAEWTAVVVIRNAEQVAVRAGSGWSMPCHHGKQRLALAI